MMHSWFYLSNGPANSVTMQLKDLALRYAIENVWSGEN